MTREKRIFLIISALGVIILTIIFAPLLKSIFFTKKSNIDLKYDPSSRADFYTFNGKLFYLTKDGLQFINSKGEILWSDTFNLTAPVMISDRGMVAVTEKDARQVMLYGETGLKANISTTDPVACISVSQSGFACIVTKGETYDLGVYNSGGERFFSGKFAPDDGYPICVDVSDDGKMLAVSFLDVSDIKSKSRVCFYYMGKNSADADQGSDSDYMFASYIEDEAVVGRISFMQDGNMAALSDKSLRFIALNPNGEEKLKENAVYKIENKVDAVDFSQKNMVCVAYGQKELNEKNAYEANTVKWYNAKGNETGSYAAPKAVDCLSTDYGSTIVAMGKQFNAVDSKGVQQWEYNAIQDIEKVLFVSSREDVLLVGINEAYTVNVNERIELNIPEEKVDDINGEQPKANDIINEDNSNSDNGNNNNGNDDNSNNNNGNDDNGNNNNSDNNNGNKEDTNNKESNSNAGNNNSGTGESGNKGGNAPAEDSTKTSNNGGAAGNENTTNNNDTAVNGGGNTQDNNEQAPSTAPTIDENKGESENTQEKPEENSPPQEENKEESPGEDLNNSPQEPEKPVDTGSENNGPVMPE